MFTPVLNGQEVRILEVKRSVKELVVKDSKATLLQ
jgi:pyruvate/2-oxoglutarate dehydrogenase complex dihydrolipoamide acyltransferase (E2) component